MHRRAHDLFFDLDDQAQIGLAILVCAVGAVLKRGFVVICMAVVGILFAAEVLLINEMLEQQGFETLPNVLK